MAIKRYELEKMNALVESGSNISDIARKYKNYDYWEIYFAVGDYSLMGKKRMITNRLNKLQYGTGKEKRKRLLNEIKGQLNEIYKLAKKNGKKLMDINKVISR